MLIIYTLLWESCYYNHKSFWLYACARCSLYKHSYSPMMVHCGRVMPWFGHVFKVIKQKHFSGDPILLSATRFHTSSNVEFRNLVINICYRWNMMTSNDNLDRMLGVFIFGLGSGGLHPCAWENYLCGSILFGMFKSMTSSNQVAQMLAWVLPIRT